METWRIRRLLVEAGAPNMQPHEARNTADLFDALADMLRHPDPDTWASTIAHLDRRLAATSPTHAGLARTLRYLQQLCTGPEERRRVAAELEDRARLLRGN